MSDEAPPLVQVRGLTRVFSSEGVQTRAVDGLDLDVHAGEFTVLAGPSGSGKTTLLQLIGALDKPTAGSVKIEGRELSTLSRRERAELRRDRIGFVFQNYNLVPVLTALENAEYVLSLQGVAASERRARVGALFEELEMRGYEHRFPRQLSGGQQQRVAFVRAVVSNPALVLADEPTANVDSKTTRTLVDVMGRLHAEHGVTFLATTHDRQVMRRAQRLLWLVDGRIAYDGAPEGFDWS